MIFFFKNPILLSFIFLFEVFHFEKKKKKNVKNIARSSSYTFICFFVFPLHFSLLNSTQLYIHIHTINDHFLLRLVVVLETF